MNQRDLAMKIAGVLCHEDHLDVAQYTWSEYDGYAEKIAAAIMEDRFNNRMEDVVKTAIRAVFDHFTPGFERDMVRTITRLAHGN